MAIHFESPAIAKERGDYRYQLLDLCSSLRMVDGEEPVSNMPLFLAVAVD